MSKNFDKKALRYHSQGQPGKLVIQPSKPSETEMDLSLAYSPGVAAPCREIAANEDDVYKYTSKGNLVGVITNGTAVLGLGDIGPLAAKPVMEGKAILFKKFANIDVFDVEINEKDPEKFITAVKALEPTFGGINLEDIKAPDCFIIEERLRKEMEIPIFHDDQHGTAIITAAALINACKVQEKKLEEIKVTVNGAGAAAITCARLFFKLGVKPANLLMCDSRGVIYKSRKDGMNKYKQEFAIKTDKRTLADAVDGADVFCGLSVAGALTKKMLKTMNKKAIVFAMANPDPEILPSDAKEVRKDIIIATGRTDFPNQVNNVLGFPSIFRGALDVHAKTINEEMKMAAVMALAELAEQEVPDSVSRAYGNKKFSFGPEYIIPKPFDPRVLMNVAPAVAKAAMESGVARKDIKNFKAYRESLEALENITKGFVRHAINKIKSKARGGNGGEIPRIIFPEGTSDRILPAINTIASEKICVPILLGNEDAIRKQLKDLDLEEINDVEIIDPEKSEHFKEYVEKFYQLRSRKGILKTEAIRLMKDPYHFSAMAVKMGHADAVVSGAQRNYANCLKPILEIIGTQKKNLASGLSIVLFKDKTYFFADTTVNIDPTSEQLAHIALHASEAAEYFDIKPSVAMLSFSNFVGKHESPTKMKRAAEILKELNPEIIADGEIQADAAVNPAIVKNIFPFSELKKGANILVFPNLDSGNIAYKLVQQLGGGEVLGPFLMGLKSPANVLQRTGTVSDAINTIILTTLEAYAYRDLKQKYAEQ